jgi:hypothetical protein
VGVGLGEGVGSGELEGLEPLVVEGVGVEVEEGATPEGVGEREGEEEGEGVGVTPVGPLVVEVGVGVKVGVGEEPRGGKGVSENDEEGLRVGVGVGVVEGEVPAADARRRTTPPVGLVETPLSMTYKIPLVSTVILRGLLNPALVPMPSMVVDVLELPAMVETMGSPLKGMVRERIVLESVTKIEAGWVPPLDEVKLVMPMGVLNIAFVPIPSLGAGPAVLPAMVVTV